MNRRSFCKLIGAAAAASPLAPSLARTDASVFATGFGQDTRTYAEFCATPPEDRIFYTVRGNRIVRERLNEGAWHPTGWGRPPALPVPGGSHDGVPMRSPIAGLAGQGPYEPTWRSLEQYECPEWYQDAKFGIWNHWSPQCVPEDGDWYARNMYIQNSGQNKYQCEHYGHPSKFGYKDLCAQWTLLNWDPRELMERYKRAGAKIFLALANHHDGFDTWNSRHHQWNAQNIGPHRDVIGTWAAEARRLGLRFGVTVHQARNWWWFQTSHGADRTGRYAAIPYDGHLIEADGKGQWWQGCDPQQLYGVKHPPDALPDASYVKNFYDRTRDLIDQHNPDLLYFDNPLFPLGWGGMNIGAYFYNHSLRTHGGKMQGVINIKNVPDNLLKCVVADIERGLTAGIMPHPWQSETCIGGWHYARYDFTRPGEYGGYMHPRDVIHWMVDVVSKNGTFILNIPGKPDGTTDSKEQLILDRIGDWLTVNGEAIYATRPWTVYGEGPNVIRTGSFQGASIGALGPKDIRFTRNKSGTVVYAIILGWHHDAFVINSLGTASAVHPGRIARVELLGTHEKLIWRQTAAGLRVALPKTYHPTVNYAASLKVTLA
ncbi:MAG: alpha-L-fucosidase [Phycisphaerales bacterium]|nr:alpha-L-fucosidase [Phycisphaerales bacterium]